MNEHTLAALHLGRAVKELVGGRPAQDQRCRLRRVDVGRHAKPIAGPEGAVGGVRPDDRQIGHPVTKLKAAHALPELIDFPNDIIAQHERRLDAHGLRVEVTPDHHIGVFQTGGEYADAHLVPPGRR
jgi:hypothetical protein